MKEIIHRLRQFLLNPIIIHNFIHDLRKGVISS